ncbi:hypothetical protein EFP50_15280 [Lacticaseibacillus paracasei]|nr:hypothetical protein [Lacticaseibacillus paracasei]
MMNRNEIIITDSDIDQIENAMGNQVHFDSVRRDIIKNLRPDKIQDIQAFPGTGKTTLLIAKLGILAQKYPDTTSGICVLSFTNAAREEVQQRLGNTVYGERILSYPNFIGTFHTFFSDFLVKPLFRSHGIRIQIIDSDITLEMRRKIIAVSSPFMFYRKPNMVMEYSLDKDFSFKKNATTQKKIISIINDSLRQGNLTYDEVLYFSRCAMRGNPGLPKNISKRFPLLFIDEAQDTSPTLWNLVKSAFSNSDIQTLGDSNQRIYDDDTKYSEAVIPRTPHFSISDSQRLTNRVASIVNPLAISGETMKGANTTFEGAPTTIILFKKNSISDVLPTFGKLILDNFSDKEIHASDGNNCFAIGRVHKKKDQLDSQKHFPANIEAYCSTYNPSNIKKSKLRFEYFREYVIYARSSLKPGNTSESAVRIVIKGLVNFLNKVSPETNKYSLYSNPFSVFSRVLTSDELMSIRRSIRILLFTEKLSEQVWINEVSNLKLSLGNLESFETSESFFEWKNDLPKKASTQIQLPKEENNNFVFSSNGRQVEIKLGSIHSVKGQTHLATLLLETYFRTYDVKNILPLLEGKHPKKQNPERMALNYVALTRSKGMVCIALPASEVNENDKKNLEARGWTFISI